MKSGLNRSLWLASAMLLFTVLALGQGQGDIKLITTIPGSPKGVTVQGEYLYVADNTASDGLRVFNFSNPFHPVQVYGDGRGSCAGVAVSENRAYAMNSDGLRILSIDNPTNPVVLGFIAGEWEWNCVTVDGHYLYLGTFSGTSIYDVTDPSNPTNVGQFDSGCCNYISVRGNYAYAASCYGGLLVYDVSDPTHPKLVGQGSIGVNYAQDVALSGDWAFVGGYTNRLCIFDISNPTNVVSLSNPPAYGGSVAVSGNYVYVAGQYGPGTLVGVDISNATNSFVAVNTSLTVFGEFYQHPHRLQVRGGYAFVAADDGLEIYNLGVQAVPLKVSSTPEDIVLSWPKPTGAFMVQQNLDLNPIHWTTLTNASVVVSGQNQVNLPKPPWTMFYRLVSQ